MVDIALWRWDESVLETLGEDADLVEFLRALSIAQRALMGGTKAIHSWSIPPWKKSRHIYLRDSLNVSTSHENLRKRAADNELDEVTDVCLTRRERQKAD